MVWSRFPFLRFVLALSAGICLSGVFPQQRLALFTLFCIPILLYTIVLFRLSKGSLSRNVLLGVLSFWICLQFGVLLAFTNKTVNSDLRFTNGLYSAYSVQICEEPIQKQQSIIYVAQVVRGYNNNKWHTTTGKIRLIQKADTTSLAYGDWCIIPVRENMLHEPLNPEEFNYKIYLERAGVYAQQFISITELQYLGNSTPNRIYAYAMKLRQWAHKHLEANIPGVTVKAIAEALLLGIRTDIDPEVYASFAGTGTLHVLAVSGLHVGLIYKILEWLFKILFKSKSHLKVQAGGIIILLIFYAFVTGLSPSVLRAVTMCCFLVVGNAYKRNNSSLNTLALSAFVLLCLNPNLIYQVGFQLSYAAVLGILIVYPWLNTLIAIESKFLNGIWQLACVTLSAQAGTWLLGLYYFHQFPVYFLPANVIVIPLVTIVLYLTLVVLLTAPIGLLSTFLGLITSYCIQFTTSIVSYINHLPGATMQGVWLEGYELIIGFIVTGALVITVAYRNFFALWGAIAFGAVLIGMRTYRAMSTRSQSIGIVYQVPKLAAIEFLQGNHSSLYLSDTSSAALAKLAFHRNSWIIKMGISETKIKHLYKHNAIQMQGIPNIQVLTISSVGLKILVNITVLQNTKGYYPDLKLSAPNLVVFDGTFTPNQAFKAVEALGLEKHQYYCTATNGAFIVGF